MSFKRDGDDRNALNNQRKRRVTELLYEDIHDGEVSRLSNGRYVCSICPHQPMFDTLNMFQVHRQGKKHKCSLAYKEQERLDFQNLIEKRSHEQFVKADDCPTTSQMPEVPKVLGVGQSHGGRKHQPKIKLNVSQPAPGSRSTDTTKAECLPGNRTFSSQSQKYPTISGNMATRDKHVSGNMATRDQRVPGNMAVRDNRPSTNTNNNGNGTVIPKRQNLHSNSSVEKEVKVADIQKFVTNENPAQTSKYYFARRQEHKDSLVSVKAERAEKAKFDILQQQEAKSWEYFKNMKGPALVSLSKQRGKVHSSQDVVTDKTSGDVDQKSGDGTEKISTEQMQATAAERKERAEKIMNAYSSGWKKDWTGKWIRDEDVEFDSDEEPPDLS